MAKKVVEKQEEKESFYPKHDGYLEFVWGILSSDDLSGAKEANLYTMNDLDIVYDKEHNQYLLDIETIYFFPNGVKDGIAYYKHLLDEFKKYMLLNGIPMHLPEETHYLVEPYFNGKADSITELYIKFKIFVCGYESVYSV